MTEPRPGVSEKRSWRIAALLLFLGALIWFAAGSQLGGAASAIAAVACALQASRVA